MFKYFKKNDPYRIVALILILVISRVVFFFFSNSDESVLTVLQQYDHSGPLSDLTFSGLKSINSVLLSAVLAAVLILLNSILLNSIFIRNASFEESTFIPAALYIIIISASKDFYLLSPSLIGSSFILISLNFLFYHIKYRGTEENILSTGFTIGLATLFYYPFFWLYVSVLIIYLLYSSTITRRYFLMTWGFILPILIAWVVFFVLDNDTGFLNTFFTAIVSAKTIGSGFDQALVAFSLGLALSLIAVIQHFSGLGMTNHQILVQKSMTWVGFFGILTFAIFGSNNVLALALTIPALSYFSTKMLVSLSKKVMAELLFISLLIAALATMFLGY